jgi:hypothetical protein
MGQPIASSFQTGGFLVRHVEHDARLVLSPVIQDRANAMRVEFLSAQIQRYATTPMEL